MKAIFLCDSAAMITRVYTPDTVEAIRRSVELEDKVYSYNELVSGAYDFTETLYIFTTWQMPSLTEDEVCTYLPKLEAVFYAAGSVQNFARPFMHNGVRIFSAWAANAIPVAEYTAAQILLANKGFIPVSRLCTSGNYRQSHKLFTQYPGNYRSGVGLIGAGMIGRKVVEYLKNFSVSVSVFDPFLTDAAAKELEVSKKSLETLFEECPVISNHLANNEQTKGMLNYSLFRKMPPNATFINTGRGAQVNEPDLCRILHERPDVTAILDVTSPEPPVNDSPLFNLPNIVLTPHIAGSSGNETERMSAYMLEEFEAVINQKPVRYEVTERMLETMS